MSDARPPSWLENLAGGQAWQRRRPKIKPVNTGLLFERVGHALTIAENRIAVDKRAWLQPLQEDHPLAGQRVTLEAYANRLRRLALAQGGSVAAEGSIALAFEVHGQGRFVTGLGLHNPLENGFLWHPTLDVPFLPGSALKGMTRAYAEVWHQAAGGDPIDPTALRRLFGPRLGGPGQAAPDRPAEAKRGSAEAAATARAGAEDGAPDLDPARDHGPNQGGDQGPDQGPDQGSVVFLDAVPTGPVRLIVEVMTPHHGNYYRGGGAQPPRESEDPKPILFLAAEKLSLQVCLLPAPGALIAAQLEAAAGAGDPLDRARRDCALAADLVRGALRWIGAGAKTKSGFGRFEASP